MAVKETPPKKVKKYSKTIFVMDPDWLHKCNGTYEELENKALNEGGYALYYQNPEGFWICRTDRRATLSLEMARSLSKELERCAIFWQIRDRDGKLIEQSTSPGPSRKP